MGLPQDYSGMGSVNLRSGNKRRRLAHIVKQTWIDPSTIDVDKFVDDQLGPDSATTADLALTATLTNDFARNAVVTVTHSSSIVAMDIVVHGLDVHGNVISEEFEITATGTTKTVTGVKAFKSITQVEATVAADASANTVNIGDGKVLGLDVICDCASLIKEFEDTTLRTNGVVVNGAATPADRLGTYTPNSTLNGALDFTVWYLSSLPEQS